MSGEPGTDAHYKKTIPFNFSGQRLRFRVSQELFSSHDVDVGTRFLLRTLVTSSHLGTPAAILDLGCGYGPLGLTLKRLFPSAEVHLTDRDALAVHYCGQNAALNDLADGVWWYGSLGYDDLRRSEFDLIVSNIPGKAGAPVIADLVARALDHLTEGGLAAIVAVTPLEEPVLGALTGSGAAEIVLHERRPDHVAIHYRRRAGKRTSRPETKSSIERGVYRRGVTRLAHGGSEYVLETAYGLPEFDTPSYATDLLIGLLDPFRGIALERLVVFNPGQGHLPVVLSRLARPEAIDLVDRDLLALRYSARNLVANRQVGMKLALLHQVGLALPADRRADLIAGVLRDDEGPAAHRHLLAQAGDALTPEGVIALAGGSTSLTRLIEGLADNRAFEVVERKRRHGQSAAMLRLRRRR